MPTSSLPRDFYDRIVNAGDNAAVIAAIRKLYDSPNPQEETDWLEFKTLRSPDSDMLKGLWLKELCGMLNNMGGVLIWGIDARKNADNIDSAHGEVPIKEPKVIKSRLIELQRSATSPAALNVEIEAHETSVGEGFIVCYIPKGEHPPYRTEDSRRQFFIRAGDTTVAMSTDVLRRMFFPELSAAFKIHGAAKYVRNEGQIVIDFGIKNIGNGTALNTFIRVSLSNRTRPDISKLTFQKAMSWHLQEAVEGKMAGIEATRPLHPDIDMLFGSAYWTCHQVGSPIETEALHGWAPYVFTASVYCRDQPPQVFTGTFKMWEMIQGGEQHVEFRPIDTAASPPHAVGAQMAT